MVKPWVNILVLFFLLRFLRHVPVVYVDYPGATSLTQIYGTFNRAMLRLIPSLRSSAQQLTDAMVEFYTMSQVHFTLFGKSKPNHDQNIIVETICLSLYLFHIHRNDSLKTCSRTTFTVLVK